MCVVKEKLRGVEEKRRKLKISEIKGSRMFGKSRVNTSHSMCGGSTPHFVRLSLEHIFIFTPLELV
jgi:hypothetical protein